jgi:hypothetical protein
MWKFIKRIEQVGVVVFSPEMQISSSIKIFYNLIHSTNKSKEKNQVKGYQWILKLFKFAN